MWENSILNGYAYLVGKLEKSGFTMAIPNAAVVNAAKWQVCLIKVNATVVDCNSARRRFLQDLVDILLFATENVHGQGSGSVIDKLCGIIQCFEWSDR